MRLLRQPNRWSCLPTAFAMLADVTLQDVLDECGHDGSEILFPNLIEPVCRRSFHIEELQYVALTYGFCLVHYVPGIVYEPSLGCSAELLFTEFFLDVYGSNNGLLLGKPKDKTLGHAVAWDAKEGLIYDPNGTKYPAEGNFVIESFYRRVKCDCT